MMMMLRSGVSSVVAVVVCLLVWTQTVSVAQAQSVKVSKSCFTPDEDITITFVNRRFPASDDWIGVFAASQKNGGFASEAAWLWTCGTQSCGSSRRRGSVIVRDNIPIGEYKAVMSKDDEEPYIGYALSSVFSVRASCTDGGGGSIPVNPATENANQVAARHLKSARDEIEGLVRGDPALAGTFLRLLFHDCIGGCDGMYYR